MRARLYLPVEGPIVSPILYIHGGGWTFGSIDTHDGTMRNLAEAAQRPVLGIDYRLAPEHPFPAPLDDVLTAIAFVETGGLGVPISAHDMAIAGDSAGANLALAALLARRDRRLPQLASAALFYGCYAPDFTTASHAEFGGRRLSAHQREHALVLDAISSAEKAPTQRALAAPVRSDLSGLPPLYLSAAGLDPLARRYASASPQQLAAAGVSFRCDHVPGVVHGCLRMTRELDAARAMIRGGRRLHRLAHATKKTWEEHNHGTPRIPEACRCRRSGGTAGTARHRADADDRALVVPFRQSAELARRPRGEVRAGESRHQDPGRGDSVGRRQRLPDPPVRRPRGRQRPRLPPWCACPGPRASRP